MLTRRVVAGLVAFGLSLAAASAPGCSSTTTSPTSTSSSSSGGGMASGSSSGGVGAHGGEGGAGGAGGRSSSSSANGGSSSSAGGSGGSAGGGGASCAHCSDVLLQHDPEPPSALCTSGSPRASKDYYDGLVTCCETNCTQAGMQCPCDTLGGRVLPNGCQGCLGSLCKTELNACGRCQSCGNVIQGLAGPDSLCTVGSPQPAIALFQDFSTCACNMCAGACGDSICAGTSPSDDCIECAQAPCAGQLRKCVEDAMAESG